MSRLRWLNGRWKLLLLLGITVVVSIAVESQSRIGTSIYIPIADVDLPLSYAFYPFLFFVIAGAANGVNLTDGIDGHEHQTGGDGGRLGDPRAQIAGEGQEDRLADHDTHILGIAVLAGILRGEQLVRSWRITVFLVCLFAAMAAPGADAMSMFYLAGPMLGQAHVSPPNCDEGRCRSSSCIDHAYPDRTLSKGHASA